MRVNVNGESRELPDGTTVVQLLEGLKVHRDIVAVEINREIVPRSRHGERQLVEGDAVEVVTFVGGG